MLSLNCTYLLPFASIYLNISIANADESCMKIAKSPNK